MSEKHRPREHTQMNGSWFSINAPHADNSLGALFMGVISLILLVALLRSQKRNRDLLAANRADSQPD